MYQRAQKGIGYLAQEASVFRKLSVENNILAVLEIHYPNKEERLANWTTSFRISLQPCPHTEEILLSGRAPTNEIAVLWLANPSFILLDEPFCGMPKNISNEEAGTANSVFRIGDTIITPSDDTILHGVTRRTIIELAQHWGYKAEQAMSLSELIDGIKEGIVTDAFAAGTAATLDTIST
ncbi:hypothetical protein FQR65_LT15783 [Abscondita terminalis]|nr:hypothetical protein FQR65_LT15783 [Abscondita terminalis]